MIKTDLHPEHFGTDHDPILAGVVRGLRDLFPPIHKPSHAEPGGHPVADGGENDPSVPVGNGVR